MGMFSGIKKAVGKVFKPIVKGLDKITGGKFSKIMGNKWVQYALMAVAIVTGGIAIANGIMAAGQAGVGAAAKAFATNMSMETGKTLVSAVVEGGKQFVVGVAKGLANPLKSDAGKALTGMFDSPAANLTGTAVSNADQLGGAGAVDGAVGGAAGETAGSGSWQQAAMDAGNTPPPAGIASNPGIVQAGSPLAAPEIANTFGSSADALAKSTAAYDPAAWGGADANLFTTGDNMASAANYGSQAAQVAETAGNAANTIDTPGLLSKLGKGVTDYATSPQGVYQIGSTLQGWAQGQALQERWDQMDEAEKKRYRSWTDGSFKMPRLTAGPATA